MLSEIFKYREGEQLNPEYLRRCVHKMLFELDKNPEYLEKIIIKLLEDINEIDPEMRTDH